MKYLSFLIYAAVSSFGLYKLKSAPSISSWEFLIGFIFYGLGMLLWLQILRTTALSIAFPVAAGSLIIATQFLGYLLLGESVGPAKVAGVAFIFMGIVIVYSMG